MHILAVAQNKGGVGKTLVSRLVAEYAAIRQKRRVLLIDTDSQCNLSRRYLDMELDPTDDKGGVYPPLHPEYDPSDPDDAGWDGRSSIADMYDAIGVTPYPTAHPNLDIAPGSSRRLIEAVERSRQDLEREILNRLRDWARHPDVQASYDLLVIDTAPTKAAITQSAVRGATHLLIPTIMDTQGMEGLYGMLQMWRSERQRREFGDDLELAAVVPNLVDGRTLNDNEYLDDLHKQGVIKEFVTRGHLRYLADFKKLDRAEVQPKSVFQLPPSNKARQDAETVCAEVMERMGL